MMDFLKMVSENLFILSAIFNLAALYFVLANDNWLIDKRLLTLLQILRWIALVQVFILYPGDSFFYISIFFLMDVLTLKNEDDGKTRSILNIVAFAFAVYMRPALLNTPEPHDFRLSITGMTMMGNRGYKPLLRGKGHLQLLSDY